MDMPCGWSISAQGNVLIHVPSHNSTATYNNKLTKKIMNRKRLQEIFNQIRKLFLTNEMCA